MLRELPLAVGLLAALAPLAMAGQRSVAGPGTDSALLRSQVHPALHVIPFPGTPDASPRSHIIFSSLRPANFSGKPIVSGSSSGVHQGQLATLPDHAGTAFIPTRPFAPGEHVAVTALLTSAEAGTVSGAPDATSLHFSFTVAVPGVTARSASDAASPGARMAAVRLRSFRTQPGLHPPPVHVSTGPAPGSRDIFLSPYDVMILNPRGQLLWARSMRTRVAYNLEVQRYQGRPVLTWWQGRLVNGRGVDGEDVILDRSYRQVAVLHAHWGYSADLHEFQITPQGTALIDAYVPVRSDLSSVGGPSDATMLDCVIEELDIRTGTVLWEWHALGHVPLTASYWSPAGTTPYDPYHLNSIQQLPGHRLLLSFRKTWAVYELDQRTGRVIWTLGGKRSSFRARPGAVFEWQHDAHLNAHGLLTVFDDGGLPEESRSSAKELHIDTRAHTVSLVHSYGHLPPLHSNTQGSAQLLADHDVFVGWGSSPDFSEYTPHGRQVFNATFPLSIDSYRAYRFSWTGDPDTRPAVAVSHPPHGTVRLYVSWNGATAVTSWRMLGGSTAQRLHPLAVARWSGFETAIALTRAPAYLAVQALDAHGRVLGRSSLVAVRGH